MSATMTVWCDCRPSCTSHFTTDSAYADTARLRASRFGWDVDTIGGTTVDIAPGHTLALSEPRVPVSVSDIPKD
ncbi:MAG TPA: hypothetical protein VGL02_32160 [Streptomyces sp.]